MTKLVKATASLTAATSVLLMGFSSIKISTRNAEALDASLQSVLRPLSQADRIEFMEAVFRVTGYKKCITEGDYRWTTLYKTPEECAELWTTYNQARAEMYISDRRMDTKKEFVRTSFIGGSTRHGHSAARSYVIFIDEYGQYLDGMIAKDIVSQSRDIKSRGLVTKRTELLGDLETEIPTLEAQLAMYERNLGKIPMVANKNSIAKAVENCQKRIAATKYKLSDKYALRDQTPRPKEERHWGVTGNDCRYVDSRRGGKSRRVALSEDVDIGLKAPVKSAMPSPTLGILGGAGSPTVAPPPPPVAVIPQNGVHFEDAIFDKSVKLVTVTKMRNFKLKASRSSPQFSADFDFAYTGQLDKPIDRANIQIMAFPKSGGDPIMFSATLPKGGKALSAKGQTLFASARSHPNASTRASDYQIGAVVTRVRYTDNTRDVLVPDMEQFKIWMRSQAKVNR